MGSREMTVTVHVESGFDPLEGFFWCLIGVCVLLFILMVMVTGDD